MAWGVYFEVSFGMFGPDGEFVGWDAARKARFDAGLSEEEMEGVDPNNALNSYVSNVSRKFTMDRGEIFDHDWPVHFATKRSHKKIGDILKVNEQVLLVSETMKDLIESLEPGRHQFRPIKMTTKGGTPYDMPYYVFVISSFIDSFNEEKTDEDAVREIAPTLPLRSVPMIDGYKIFEKFALDQTIHEDRHIWREARLVGPAFFISDELERRISELELVFPKRSRVRDI